MVAWPKVMGKEKGHSPNLKVGSFGSFWGKVANVASHYFSGIQDDLPRLPGGDFMGHLVHNFFHAVFGRD